VSGAGNIVLSVLQGKATPVAVTQDFIFSLDILGTGHDKTDKCVILKLTSSALLSPDK
jgi:hypothetical protein